MFSESLPTSPKTLFWKEFDSHIMVKNSVEIFVNDSVKGVEVGGGRFFFNEEKHTHILLPSVFGV